MHKVYGPNISAKGFHQQWCEGGSKQLQHSAALEHAESMSHKKAFDFHLKGLGKVIQGQTEKQQLLLSSTGQQPIIHSVNVINEKDFKLTKKKFESAYFLAKNKATLSLFLKLISQEERHSVTVGTANHNRTLGTLCLEYIAENLREIEGKIKYKNFYSLFSRWLHRFSSKQGRSLFCFNI